MTEILIVLTLFRLLASPEHPQVTRCHTGFHAKFAHAVTQTPLVLSDTGKVLLKKNRLLNLLHYARNRVNRRITDAKRLHRLKNRKRKSLPPFSCGDPNKKAVALTFDDGPHPPQALKILSILRKHKVKATFFVVGKMAEKCPDIVRLQYEEGHEIANHTYNHFDLTKLPPDKVHQEWKKCNDVIESILGFKPDFCRPPGGNYNNETVEAADKEGLTPVLWTDDPGDYMDIDKSFLMDKFKAYMCNGAVIILHDGGKHTAEILSEMITYLKERGYAFQTMSEMAGAEAETETEGGERRQDP